MRPEWVGRIPAFLAESPLLGKGGFAVFEAFPDRAVLARLREEARRRLRHAEASASAASDPRGIPAYRSLRATGRAAQRVFYHGRTTLRFLSEVTGLAVTPTGSRGGYVYYTRAGDHIAVHSDRDGCDLAVLTCLADTGDASGEGGALCLYPDRLAEPIEAIRATPERGVVRLRLRPGQSVVLLGGWLAHGLSPVSEGQRRIVSALCYRVGPPGDAAARPAPRPAFPPATLEDILAPLDAGDFLGTVWGRAFRHVPGRPEKFAGLLPWSRLNEILRHQRLEPPRLRLVRRGQPLPAAAFLQDEGGVPRVRPAGLTRELRRGATLILDAVDELHEPLGTLAEALEASFHAPVQLNAYAGWRAARGFDLHWDDHEVLVLQVAGRKRWTLYRPTRPHPVAGDRSLRPRGTPAWRGVLRPGDLLYIPRGVWHVAEPLGEPTSHLTAAVALPTGLDLLRWLVGEVRGAEVARRDLPRFADEEERAAYLAELRAALERAWRPDLLDRFLRHLDAMALPRPRLSLPWSATPGSLPPTDEARVRLLARGPLDLQPDARRGVVSVACQGQRWMLGRDAGLVLSVLDGGAPRSIAEVTTTLTGQLDRRAVRRALGALVRDGLVAVADESIDP